jgi:hypothetical protein
MACHRTSRSSSPATATSTPPWTPPFAVFNEDVVRHYQEFLDRRREARSMDEYNLSLTASGLSLRNTSTGEKSSWAAARDLMEPLASMSMSR